MSLATFYLSAFFVFQWYDKRQTGLTPVVWPEFDGGLTEFGGGLTEFDNSLLTDKMTKKSKFLNPTVIVDKKPRFNYNISILEVRSYFSTMIAVIKLLQFILQK